MNKKFSFILLLLLLPGLLLAAGERRLRKAPTPITLTGLEDLPANMLIAYPPYPPPPESSADLIGDTVTVGTTWYDVQHNSQMGRMIVKDEFGYLQMVWTSGLDEGSISRHVFYNYIDPQGLQGFPGIGTQVDASTRAGFTSLAVGWGGRAFPAFHQINVGSPTPHSAVAVDYFLPHLGGFTVSELPWYNGEDRPFIWPRIAIKQDSQLVIISRENGTAYQTWSLGNVDSTLSPWVINYTDQQLTEDADAISNEVAASRVSNRLGVAYPATAYPGLNFTNHGSDIHAMVDNDGVDLDFANWWNVTNFFPPDTTLPDTLMANADTLRAFADCYLFFDMNDVAHIAFTTRAYFALQGETYWNASCIWHWSEEWPNEYHMVAKAWDAQSEVNCGNWNYSCQRPSIGQDPSTGYLYIAYQQFDVDSAHLSAAGWPSSDVYISVSTDGGQGWSVGTNVTDTPTPQGALPGQCLSENYPSLAELVDGYCHLLYQLDLDAGQAVPPASEGTVTFNSIKYHKVPVDSISETPLMDPYPFHVEHIIDTTRTSISPPLQPHLFALEQNVPNPFNPTTTIRFSLQSLSDVELAVFNLRGELVASVAKGVFQAGAHTVGFNGSGLPSGVYIYRLKAAGQSLERKMVLIK